jgi:hypothetical protein
MSLGSTVVERDLGATSGNERRKQEGEQCPDKTLGVDALNIRILA